MKRKLLRRFAWTTLTTAVLAAAGGLALALWLPDVAGLKNHAPGKTAFMLLAERRAREAGRPFKLEYEWTPLGQISPNLVHAVLLSEDAGFYAHHGVDFEELKVAISKDLDAGRFAYGASTLTQQLARNLYLSPSKNPLRKLEELLITRRLEQTLGKRRILELYLNVAEWGEGVYGAEAAARSHFNKSASDLTPEEAVALAVALPSPLRYAPEKDGRYLDRQRRLILARMRERGYIEEVAGSSSPRMAAPPLDDDQLGL